MTEKAHETANEDEVIASGQSQLAFVGIGSGGTRSGFQKVKSSGQQRMVGPQGRWQRDSMKEKRVREIHRLDIF